MGLCEWDESIGKLYFKVCNFYHDNRMEEQDREACALELIEKLLEHNPLEVKQYIEGLLPNAWLWRCADNHRKDYQRHKQRVQFETQPDSSTIEADNSSSAPDDYENEPEKEALQHEMLKKMNEELNQLKPDKRELVLLHIAEGATYAELALNRGLSEDTVRMRVNRALHKLRLILEVAGWTEEDTRYYLALLSTPPRKYT